jgi:ketosteroid isomerase-like protein
MSTLNKGIIVCILLVLAGCATQVDTEKERAAILQTDKEWVTAASEGRDLERIISFWADDAAIYPPGLPSVVGKEAIRQFIGKSLQTPGFSVWWETDHVTVSKGGDIAYATGKNRFTFNDAAGKTVTANGKAITVWRKEPAGSWQCVIDIWN